MGCASASAVKVDSDDREGASSGDRAEEVGDAFGDSLPQARNLPRLLDSAAFQRSPEDVDNLSVVSSRPTSITAIPTPSIALSNLESVALSSTRAEVDKESFFDVARSVGVPSVCGTIGGKDSMPSQDDIESNSGDLLESRYDTQTYLQELELVARMTEIGPAPIPEAVDSYNT
uniref:Uncharacterized protein n=1 Tax=Alexandrium monilatum TaxID=311494 RepID=A0A7S4QNU1_9DINO|mmetsp:Transcript_109278/g.326817  ORF Transcript_109278/g.326817 Transcript_109278/m.326817 type:complete len:174 (-) Transcript_109278:89-610(-)